MTDHTAKNCSALEALERLIDDAMPCNWAETEDEAETEAWRNAQRTLDRLSAETGMIWAITTEDRKLAAFRVDGGEWIPLVATHHDVDGLQKHGRLMAWKQRRRIELVRFELVEVVETFYPETGHA